MIFDKTEIHARKLLLHACIAISISLQGCADLLPDPIREGFSPQEAEAITLNLAGKIKPMKSDLRKYYQEKNVYTSVNSTWSCNGKYVRVAVIDMVIDVGVENIFTGVKKTSGDPRCFKNETEQIAGRYDRKYLYLYFPSDQKTYIQKYKMGGVGLGFDPSATETDVFDGLLKQDIGLTFVGSWIKQDGVLYFLEAAKNPRPITNQRIPESDSWADWYESSEFIAQDKNTTLTSNKEWKETTASENIGASRAAALNAKARAESEALDAANNRARTQAAISATLQNITSMQSGSVDKPLNPYANLSQNISTTSQANTSRSAVRQSSSAVNQSSQSGSQVGGVPSTGRNNVASSIASVAAPSAPITNSTIANVKLPVRGPDQLEAVAVCWEKKNHPDMARCYGPTQFTLEFEQLSNALGYAGCGSPRLNDGSREHIDLPYNDSELKGRATVYLCGYGLYTEIDVAKKLGITVQRNTYRCDGRTSPTSHCKDNFSN